MTTTTEKKVPSWLKLSDEGVTVTLRYPTELNNIKTDTLVMRAPTVRDVRAAGAVSGGDAEKRELQLFSSLTEVAPNELEGLKVVDYNRVQEGYFRLVDESEREPRHPETTGQALGVGNELFRRRDHGHAVLGNDLVAHGLSRLPRITG